MANEYTYRQAMILCEYLVKEKFLVVSEVLGAFSGKRKADPSSPSPSPSGQSSLPSWYRMPRSKNIKIVDLDGPLSALQPYLGRGAMRKGRTSRKQRS